MSDIIYEKLDLWRFGETYHTRLPMKFLMSTLCDPDLHLLSYKDSRPEKADRIRKALDSDVDPLSFEPIQVTYFYCQGETSIWGGVHRVREFNKRNCPMINCLLEIIFSYKPWMNTPLDTP